MAKKEKIYVRSLITNDILLGTPDGPVRLFIDSDKRLSIDLDDNSGQNKSIKLDPDSKKIVVDEITFQDGSSLSLSNNLIPSEKISEIPESKLSSDLRSKINSSNSAINSYFDENGKLKENNTPTDYSEIRTKAIDGKSIADTLSGFFDDNNKLKTNNLTDSVITTLNFNDTLDFDTRFNNKNPITIDNFSSNFDTAFAGKNPITIDNFEAELDFDTRFAGKNPITTTNFGSNFDTAFTSKNPITTTNFDTTFNTAFTSKNPITAENFDQTLDFDTRFAGKNPITTANFGSNFDTAFAGKNPITTANFETNLDFDVRFAGKDPVTTGVQGNFESLLNFDTRFNNAFNAKNAITTTNFEDNFDNRFNSKNPITTINFATNFDIAFASKNTITIDNFSSSFDAAFIGKNAITTANFDTTLDFDTRFNNKNPITTTNFETTLDFDTRFAGKNPITTANFETELDFDTRFAGKNPITADNFGSNFDTAFTGKNPITTANFGSNFDTAFTGKNPVTTGIEGNFDDLFDGKVPTGYETWNALAINATNGNEALSKFSGAGGKLPIDGVIPPGDYTGWGEINTDIAKGISADNDLNGLDFSIDNSDPNNPIVKINKGGSRGFATNTIGKSSIGLGNVANESPAAIRAGIGLSVDSTTGQISITRSGTSTLTANPLTSTEFTNTKTNASNALTNAASAQSTANSANSLANTIEGRFTAGKLNEANAADALKNSNVTKASIGLGSVEDASPTTIRQGITIDENGALQGIGNGSGTTISNNRVTLQLAGQTLTFNNGTSNPILLDSGNVGLGNVENKSSTDIRNEIQIVNGVLNGIGTSGIVVNNASIGLSRDPTSGEITLDKGVGTPVKVNPFTATRFTEVSGVANSALANAATAQSTADTASNTATAVRNFFGTEPIPLLKDSNTPAGLKNSNLSLSLVGTSLTLTNGGGSSLTLGKANVGLGNVANESPATIRSGITVTNGVLNGIGTANIVVDNSSISLTTDSTSGEITLNKGVGSPITVNPFASTTFNTVSSTATSAQTAAGNAQTAAEAAQATADDAEAEIGSLEVTGSPNIPGAIFLKSSRGQLGGNITATQLLLGELVNQTPRTINEKMKLKLFGSSLILEGAGADTYSLDFSSISEGNYVNNSDWESSTSDVIDIAQTSPYTGEKFLVFRTTSGTRYLKFKKVLTGSVDVSYFAIKSINGTYDSTGLNLERADSGDDLYLQYSTDGLSWTTYQILFSGSTAIQTSSDTVSITGISDPYYIRFSQAYSAGAYDHYALKDISIVGNASQEITKSTIGLGVVENYSLAQIKNSTFGDSNFTTLQTDVSNAQTTANTAQSTANTVSGYFNSGIIKDDNLPGRLKETLFVNISNNINYTISGGRHYFISDIRTLKYETTITLPSVSSNTGLSITILCNPGASILSKFTVNRSGNDAIYFPFNGVGLIDSFVVKNPPGSGIEVRKITLISNGSLWIVDNFQA